MLSTHSVFGIQIDSITDNLDTPDKGQATATPNTAVAKKNHWSQNRDLLHKLYITKGWSLKKVKQYMEKEHGFIPVEVRAYEKAFKRLRIASKNVPKETMQAIISHIEERQVNGQETDVYWRGELLSRRRIQRAKCGIAKGLARGNTMSLAEEQTYLAEVELKTPTWCSAVASETATSIGLTEGNAAAKNLPRNASPDCSQCRYLGNSPLWEDAASSEEPAVSIHKTLEAILINIACQEIVPAYSQLRRRCRADESSTVGQRVTSAIQCLQESNYAAAKEHFLGVVDSPDATQTILRVDSAAGLYACSHLSLDHVVSSRALLRLTAGYHFMIGDGPCMPLHLLNWERCKVALKLKDVIIPPAIWSDYEASLTHLTAGAGSVKFSLECAQPVFKFYSSIERGSSELHNFVEVFETVIKCYRTAQLGTDPHTIYQQLQWWLGLGRAIQMGQPLTAYGVVLQCLHHAAFLINQCTTHKAIESVCAAFVWLAVEICQKPFCHKNERWIAVLRALFQCHENMSLNTLVVAVHTMHKWLAMLRDLDAISLEEILQLCLSAVAFCTARLPRYPSADIRALQERASLLASALPRKLSIFFFNPAFDPQGILEIQLAVIDAELSRRRSTPSC